MGEGDYSTAERSFETSARLNNDALSWYLVGEARLAAGDLEGARAAYSKALELREAYPLALDGMARVALAQGNLEEALELYSKLEANPDFRAYSEVKRASILLKMDDLDEAERASVEALTRNPYMPEAWYTLAQVYFSRGQRERAADCLERAITTGYPASEVLRGPMARALGLGGELEDRQVP